MYTVYSTVVVYDTEQYCSGSLLFQDIRKALSVTARNPISPVKDFSLIRRGHTEVSVSQPKDWRIHGVKDRGDGNSPIFSDPGMLGRAG